MTIKSETELRLVEAIRPFLKEGVQIHVEATTEGVLRFLTLHDDAGKGINIFGSDWTWEN